MSIDTYFCFCCLSTNDLSSLFSNDTNTNYAILLQSLFNISISLEDYEYDGHICNDCAHNLTGIQKFKAQVFETLNILQNNCLIEISNENDLVKVKKTQESLLEIEEKQASKYIVLFENTIEDWPLLKCTHIIRVANHTVKNKKPEKVRNEQDILDKLITPSEIQIEEEILEKITHTKPLEGEHSEKKRDRQIAKQVTQYEVPDDLKCKECGLMLPNIYTYHTHMNEHYPNHICEACGKGFLTEKRLKRHMPSHKTGPFKCQVCDAEFTNYNTLNSHRQRKHNTVELYKCPHCDKRFGTFTRRAVHLAAEHLHSAGKYVCKICNKRFLISGSLSAHVRRAHIKARPHSCGACGALFPHRRDLAAHEHKHTANKPYRCTLCDNRYPRKKALVVHMRTHADERRFACEVCGKRFLQKCTLLVHAKTHNREAEPKTVETESVEYTFIKWSEENCT